MQPIEARRSERVHYRAPVELWAGQRGDDARPVLAQTLDLGAGGMRVCAPVRMQVGAQVTCRFTLDGEHTALSGKIAWLAKGERDHGMGICFDPLGSQESALVQHMLDRSHAGYRTVELRFAGMSQPIRARARAKTHGLRLSAALPILARGTELSFRLDEEGPSFTGRISDATLREEGDARRIDVEVEVVDRDGVRFRRHARYGYPDEIEADEQRGAQAPAAALTAAPPPTESRRLRRAALRPMMIAACAGAIAGWSAAPQIGAVAEPESRLQQTQRASEPVPLAPAPLPAPALAASAAADTPEAPAPAPAPAGEPAAQQQQPAGASAKPMLVLEEGVTRVLLPFEGTLAQMRTMLWASPYALAITLPQGRVALAEGRHPLHAGGLGDLRIARRDGEQLLRVMLAQPIARYTVALDGRTLELRIVHASAAARHP